MDQTKIMKLMDHL